jgi:hypothetical protein
MEKDQRHDPNVQVKRREDFNNGKHDVVKKECLNPLYNNSYDLQKSLSFKAKLILFQNLFSKSLWVD